MLRNRVWFVTGTSSGLGNALVHELLDSGYCVIATARQIDSLQEELSRKYDAEILKRAVVTKLDVTKPEQVEAAFAAGLEKFGRVDVVVNNAGYAVLAEIEAFPMEDARLQFEIMFWGPVHICKEAVRIFRKVNSPGGGQIFNISSTEGYSSQPTLSYYNSAKFALEGFTESLRKEMDPEWNIQATIVEPGGFNTNWRDGNMRVLPPHPDYTADTSPAKQYRTMLAGLPFIGDPEKAAKAFLDLAEEKQDLPLRVQFGSDALAVIRHTAMKTISDSEKWESISHSTSNLDGIDPKEYTMNLLAALG
ncbi:hypothetical protein E4T56_gene352 [Termitomyces sp. T112]|nr:hypothetical protein E4T56_gene352 [Termitomyces sp. T112]